ncbi:hypothetical protein DITRI_Ditri16bG0121900 [Diplodiscus trichospermus]
MQWTNPAKLVQVALQCDKGKPNFYDVSLVDGYNLPVSVATRYYSPKCTIGSCSKNLKILCPQELEVLNKDGEVVACKREHMRRSEAFTAIRNYRSDDVEHMSPLRLLRGLKLMLSKMETDEKRYYKLTFHNKDRDRITRSYLRHVLEVGKAIDQIEPCSFEHPATFKNVATDAKKKEEIENDLIKFRDGRDYYRRIGKAWKRGYLLYGPPGTGKSTMIAAMANLLEYDVYDLELTAVKDNTELWRLLIDTSSKSIIVIEDIDCSIDLTGQRENKKKEKAKKEKDDEKLGPITKMVKEEETTDSKLTLSGVLNFTDGLWSSCGGERIIVFTTNYLEKLDPALIRKGRTDKEIEMSYCCFDAFKVLAKNYL